MVGVLDEMSKYQFDYSKNQFFFFTKNKKFRSKVVLIHGKSVYSLVVCSVSLVPLLSQMQPSLINSNSMNLVELYAMITKLI